MDNHAEDVPATSTCADDNIITEGKYAIMRKLNGTKSWLVRLRKNNQTTVENINFKYDALFGRPYGVYDVVKGQAKPEHPAEAIKKFNSLMRSSEDAVAEVVEGKPEQSHLVRDKIEIKKAKKSLTLIQIEKANTRLLAEFFYQRSPEGVGYLRSDHAALILHHSGIKPGARVLIFDQCQGIITAYIVERLGGTGHCVVLHNSKSASTITCFHNRQFPDEIKQTLRTLSVQRLLGRVDDTSPKQDVGTDENKVSEKPVDISEETVQSDRTQREIEAHSWFSNPKTPGFGLYDAVLVICKNANPTSVLEKTLPALRTSGNVVVYSSNSADIAQAKRYLEANSCVWLDIRASQCREIQVLPHRTHPLMQHLVAGGYVLSGIRALIPVLQNYAAK